jgi:hypothetical protein
MTMRSQALPFLVACATLAPGALAGQSWRDVTLSREASGEESLVVAVKYGAGRLRIGSADGQLYRMQLRYDEENFAPLANYASSGRRLSLGRGQGGRGELRIGVESVGKNVLPGKDRFGGEMELDLARGLPMELEMDFGAVQADLDLGGLALTDLELSTGASETRLDVSSPNRARMPTALMEVGAANFTATRLGNLNAAEIEVSAGVGKVRLELTGDWQRDASLSVDMGLGSLELVVPEGLGLRLTRETFLTRLDPEGLVKRGDSYYSTDWATAEHKVDVTINAAFGSIKVLWSK